MQTERELGDLRLIVRALHRDVSDLDVRLQVLEQEIRRLHEKVARGPDLAVVTANEARRELPA